MSLDWDRIRELYRDHPFPVDFQKALFGELRKGPACVEPGEDPGLFGFWAWERSFWGPFGPLDPRPATFRDEILPLYPFPERESLRLAAVLALPWFEHHPSDDFDTTPTSSRARIDLHRYLRLVMELGGKEGSTYFDSYRAQGCRHSEPARDPYVREVMAFLLMPDENQRPRLRAAFTANGVHPLLLAVAHWLVRRYAFEDLDALGEAVKQHPATGPWRRLRLSIAIARWSTRLVAANAVAHFAWLAGGGFWTAAEALVNDALVSSLVVITAMVGFSASLVFLDLRRHAWHHPNPWDTVLFRVLPFPLLVSVLLAFLSHGLWAHFMAHDAGAPPPLEGGLALLALLMEATATLSLGLVLQLIWEDKPITESI